MKKKTLKKHRRPQMRSAASALSSRSRFMDNVDGITFHGRRNMYKALGYDRSMTPQMYRSKFRRNAVAQRVVTAMPKATWRGGAEVIETDDPTLTAFEQAWISLERKLNVWAVFHRADILAGLGRYAIILIGSPGELDVPLEQGSLTMDQVVYLTPFMEEDAVIEKFDTDYKSPRFGMPIFYSVRRLVPNAFRTNTPETVGRRVHYTRVLHVADGLLDDHVYGIPRLEKIWNLLIDLEKVTGGGAEAFWKRADQGLVLNLDPMLTMRKDPATGKFLELEQMQGQIDAYEHDLKRVLLMRGVKVETLASDTADISGPVQALMSQISAGSEIPQRILMGSEAAKLASAQDADTWDERVQDRRSEFAAPQIVKPFVERMIWLGVLPTPKGHFDCRWPEVKNLNESQRADLASKWAGLNKAAGDTVVTANDIRDKILGLDPLSTSRGSSEAVATYPNDQNESQDINHPRTPAYGYQGGADLPPKTIPGDAGIPPRTPSGNAPAPKANRSRWAAGKGRSKPWQHVHDTADRFRR